MIYSVHFSKRKTKHECFPLSYYHYLDVLNDNTINFKKGVNIVVGDNGSGKSTLIKALRYATFCIDSKVSRLPNNVFCNSRLDEILSLGRQIAVKADYRYNTYNVCGFDELSYGETCQPTSVESCMKLYNKRSMSSGQDRYKNLEDTIFAMFGDADRSVKFDTSDQEIGRFDGDNITQLKLLLCRNQQDCDPMMVTMLMDEPDRGLDLNNLQMLYDILSSPRDDVQIIAAVHNVALLYRLSKLPNINFIELTKEYMVVVHRFMNNNLEK